jgi:hypothetical protein
MVKPGCQLLRPCPPVDRVKWSAVAVFAKQGMMLDQPFTDLAVTLQLCAPFFAKTAGAKQTPEQEDED